MLWKVILCEGNSSPRLFCDLKLWGKLFVISSKGKGSRSHQNSSDTSIRKTEYPFQCTTNTWEDWTHTANTLTVCISNPVKKHPFMTKIFKPWLMVQIFQKYSIQQKIWTDCKSPFWDLTCGGLWASCWLTCQRLMFICGLAKWSFYEGKLQY